MTDPTSPSGFDATSHPRGQPDNPGKFKRRPLPEPPPARRQDKGSRDEAVADTASPARPLRESRPARDENRLLSELGEHLAHLNVESVEAHFALARSAQRSEASAAERKALSAEAAARAEAATAAWARLRDIDALPSRERMDAIETLVEELKRTAATTATAKAAPSHREVVLQRVYGAEFVNGAEWRCADCGDRTDLRVWHIVTAYRDEHPDAWTAKCVGCALWGGGLQDDVWPAGASRG